MKMSQGLSGAHKDAWVSLLVAYNTLAKRIDTSMREAGLIGMDVYDVLLSLENADEHRLRMSELADAVLLTRSGMTRLIDRLERDGLIERGSCPGDRRVTYAHLTAKGLAERKRAWGLYQSEIDRYLGSQITEAEATALATILKRLIPTGDHRSCPKEDC